MNVINDKNRKKKVNANKRIWTDEMFEEARTKLYSMSDLSKKVISLYVETPCRIWNKLINSVNVKYPYIHIFGKSIKAHILAAEINIKRHKPNKNLVARHLCGNRLCCEPTHIVFGTIQQNNNDTLVQGKSNFGKLNENTVKEIRNTYMKDGLTQIARAKKYNLSTSAIRSIEKCKTWKHIL
jgi:hypothetical protein